MDTSADDRRRSILRSCNNGATAMTTPQVAAQTARTVVSMSIPIAKRSCSGTTPSQTKGGARAVTTHDTNQRGSSRQSGKRARHDLYFITSETGSSHETSPKLLAS